MNPEFHTHSSCRGTVCKCLLRCQFKVLEPKHLQPCKDVSAPFSIIELARYLTSSIIPWVAQHDSWGDNGVHSSVFVSFLHHSVRNVVDILCLMTQPRSSLFLFSFFLFPLAFALPLQEPVPGVYTCYSAADPFDLNAQSINATLEFFANQTYRFTTASATEEGMFTSSLYQGSDDGTNTLFQSGSNLALQPNTSNTIYQGSFLMDYLGEGYVLIANNNNVMIRCDSQLASLEGAMQVARDRNEYDEPPLEFPVTEGFERLEYLATFQPGIYACAQSYDSVHGLAGAFPSYYGDDELSIASVALFANGTTLTVGKEDIYRSQYSTGTYSFDVTRGRLNAQGGMLGGINLLYGKNALGKTSLYSRRTDYSEDEDGNWLDIQYIAELACEYAQEIPAELANGFPDSTPKIDLNNIVVTASKYDSSVNTDLEPIPDTYYCYPSYSALEIGEGYPRYLREYVLEILPNGQYSFDGQAGTFRTGVDDYYLQWQSGPLNPTGDIIEDENDYGLPYSATVEFSDWGSEIQRVEVPDDKVYIYIDCFQQGAREQKALLDFAIKQPIQTTYACLPSGDNPQMVGLELLPDNHYRFNGEEGSYETFANEQSGEIVWESGLLHDETDYTVDDATGLRTLTFTFTQVYGIIPVGSSTETTMVCQGVGPANLIPKYSDTPAPPLPAGSGGLNGFYAKGEYENIDGVASSSAEWTYYHFLPDGSMYQDGFVTGDECTKTYPNGKPVCKGYSLQGNVLSFSDGDSVSFVQADNGGVILDGVLYDNKGLTGSQTLNGKFEFLQTTSSPVFSPTNGSFSSLSSSYTFTGNTYEYSSIGESTFFAGVGFDGPGVFGQNSDSDNDSGNYSINGNIITFTSAQGYTKACTFFFPVAGDTTNVNICGTDYSISKQ
jgi:hypothetical protein